MFTLPPLTDTLEDELLCALALAHFGRIEVALRVDREVVDRAELPGLAPVPTELADDAAVVAHEHPHVVVLAVGVVQPGLGSVVRDLDVPGRAAAARRAGDDELLHEGPVLLQDLGAVLRPVRPVGQAVPCEPSPAPGGSDPRAA